MLRLVRGVWCVVCCVRELDLSVHFYFRSCSFHRYSSDIMTQYQLLLYDI